MAADLNTVLPLWYAVTRIPASLFFEDKLLAHAAGEEPDLNLPLLLYADLPDDLPPLWQSVVFGELLFGGIRLHDGKMLFLGPVLPFECGQDQATHVLSLIGRPLKDIGTIMLYFNACGRHTEESLASSITLLSYLLYGTPGIPVPITWTERVSLPYKPQEITVDTSGMNAQRVFEEELLSYVRYGRPDALRKKMQSVAPARGDLSTTVPLYRPYIMMALTLASRAAVAGGVSYTRSMQVLDHYINLLFDPRKQIGRIYSQSFLQYAEMVEQLRSPADDNALAQSAVRYICNHLGKKLTPTVLAKELGYNTSYLCSEFKKHTGFTVSQYVRQAKTDEAKRLLELDRYTCQEIAEVLGFPSQSVFTDAFRHETGQSPTAWRKANASGRTGTI